MRDPLFERQVARAGFTNIRGSMPGTDNEQFLDFFEARSEIILPKWDSQQIMSFKFYGQFDKATQHFNFLFARATLEVERPGERIGPMEPFVVHDFVPGVDCHTPVPTKAEMSLRLLAMVATKVECLDRARQVMLLGQDSQRENRNFYQKKGPRF